ncbi:anti-sigma factor [Actinocrinis sp.]|uniref:anti-sigma factor n=1 Tax=Actinocrinis sp. TaxID=1920516 RepID=UPI002D464178|nr:anti-sigma factor [Actinocrinis sp.]HZP53548.1 anti-sigma factor [Actinocrinis sp.]
MTMNAMPDVHTLTGAYVCDALAPAEREAFEEHLAQCSACSQEVAELREVTAVLGKAVALEPPARLKSAVDARVAVTRQLPPEVSGEFYDSRSGSTSESGASGGPLPEAERSAADQSNAGQSDAERSNAQVTPIGDAPSRRRRRGLAWSGWAAAAVLAGVAIGLGVHSASQQRQLNALSQQAGVVQQLLSAPDARSGRAAVRTGGTAMVLDSRSRDEAVISFTGLSAPPTGKTYQLWMIGPTGARSGGLLTVPATGNPNPVVAHGLGDAQTIGLTVEPAHGSAQPTTTPVLLLPMGS